jgi:predicted RNase H-like nuclease (RuvC/YqgF family)
LTDRTGEQVNDTLEFALLARVREVLAGSPSTEIELRRLAEQADAWALTLDAQLRASEVRLAELAGDTASPLVAIADELRRIEKLAAELRDTRTCVDALSTRSRELRNVWLVQQGGQPPS